MDPEKKKTIVVGALFVAMLGIGAFQFSKMGEEPAAPAAEQKSEEAEAQAEEKSEAKSKETKNPMYALALPARDPFRPAAFSVTQPEAAAPVAPVPAPKADGRAVPLPKPMGGQLQPMPVGEGPGNLPGLAGGLPAPGETPNVPVAPPKPRFSGKLIGALVGARSAAVFRFGGSERIVTVGSEIEPGVRLLSVSPRKAVVRFHGETITLHLTDEAPAAPASSAPASSVAPKSAPTPASAPDTTPTETPNE